MDPTTKVPRRSGAPQDLYVLDAAASGGGLRKQRGTALSASKPGPVRRIQQRLSVVPATTPTRIAPEPVRHETRDFLAAKAQVQTRSYASYISFFLLVVIPTAIAVLYYGLIASDQYVAEFRFTVRDSGMTSMTTATTSIMGAMGLGSSGSTVSDNYLVTDYLASRQVVEELQKRVNLVGLYSKPSTDWWARFDPKQPLEKFVDYWRGMVTTRFDMVTGLATATVRAFSPQDALLIADTMVSLSEQLINGIERRSQVDAVNFASGEVEKAQKRLGNAQAEVTKYRNKFGLIDPTTSVAASNSSLLQSQRSDLSKLELQLTTLLTQNLSLSAPAVVTLKSQISSLKEQLQRTEFDVAKGNNGSALSQIVGEFEKLNLEVLFAQKLQDSTMTTLETARANAAAQHLYITPYVRPSLPESSIYPNRFISILLTAAAGFAIWLITLMIIRSIRERFG